MQSDEMVELEHILIQDGWRIENHAEAEARSGSGNSAPIVVILTAPTGARFAARGLSRLSALHSAAISAGLIETE
jgi:hypothetical protein